MYRNCVCRCPSYLLFCHTSTKINIFMCLWRHYHSQTDIYISIQNTRHKQLRKHMYFLSSINQSINQSIGMYRTRWFLAVLRSVFHSSLSYTFSCHSSPPTILPSSLTSSSHLFLGLPLRLVVSRFMYNTLLGILFSSILCTCPNTSYHNGGKWWSEVMGGGNGVNCFCLVTSGAETQFWWCHHNLFLCQRLFTSICHFYDALPELLNYWILGYLIFIVISNHSILSNQRCGQH